MDVPYFEIDSKTNTVILDAQAFLGLLANQQPAPTPPDKPAPKPDLPAMGEEKVRDKAGEKPALPGEGVTLCGSRWRGVGSTYLCMRELKHQGNHWNDDLGAWR